jgi:hypothetical protein
MGSDTIQDIMPTIQITLSEPLQQFVQGRVAELGLDQADQYFEQLLEEEQSRRLDEYYMEEVRKGLESGPPIRVTEENRADFWNGIKEQIRRRHEMRCKKEVVVQ